MVIFNSPTHAILPYDIELSGTFNQWQLNGTSKMKWQEIEKKYLATIANDGVDIYFNLYKNGDWQNPIATEFGKPFTCGFIVDPVKESSFEPEFYGWAKESKIIPPRTVVGNLVTIEDFSMTLLGRHGEVYVYLPENYQQEPDKHYPVAYMLDGQNLFSESLSYSYEWKVDEALTALGMEVIVVGISNGPERWQEYNPWDSVNYMGNSVKGSGKQTIQFIKEQLIPYIDGNFRTLKGAENTALIGSSLGGLMALYAGLEHSDTFAKVAAFSPSFSFATLEGQQSLAPEQSNLIKATKQADSNHRAKFYFDVGEVEYGSFKLIDALSDAFLQAGYSSAQLQVVKDNKGRHCELDWSRRFPRAITWLFDGSD
jgi:pullulanase